MNSHATTTRPPP
uniref:Uncharacterized protein n=1 Tax=Arundo donax TaxID=35708 RepID=A0A0A8YVQ8_ARUDO